MALRIKKTWGRIQRKYFGRERAHKRILAEQTAAVLDRVDAPVIVETGCIRKLDEGTESTLTIASLVRDRGRFFSFELRPEHVAISRQCCGDVDRFVTYVEGDSVANLERLVADGTLARVDLAFLDSANDGEHIFREFKAIEDQLLPGAILVVDDVLWADKGKRLVPYIEASAEWDAQVFNVENGMMVATRRD
ncbi:MAG: class I SAM-dependent methyltransferase [Xanthomonadales bacterium]|nr:class I SAM-dependent methyltransferase [Xanthomonadales bacterium]